MYSVYSQARLMNRLVLLSSKRSVWNYISNILYYTNTHLHTTTVTNCTGSLKNTYKKKFQSTTFIIEFRAYFESLLLKHVMSQDDKSGTEKYSLSLELHNLNYLKELLLTTNMHLSSKELAVLGLLSDIDIIQFEQLHRYYAFYIENVNEVCPLLNNLKLCGQMYSTVVRHLYQKFKCATIWAYLQNFVKSPCMEYFQCKVAHHLHDLESYYGVMHLSQDELSYINIRGWYCYERYRIDGMMRNLTISNACFTLICSNGFYCWSSVCLVW